jgi:hypothetical protein
MAVDAIDAAVWPMLGSLGLTPNQAGAGRRHAVGRPMSAVEWVGTVICALTWLYALFQVGGLAREIRRDLRRRSGARPSRVGWLW